MGQNFGTWVVKSGHLYTWELGEVEKMGGVQKDFDILKKTLWTLVALLLSS